MANPGEALVTEVRSADVRLQSLIVVMVSALVNDPQSLRFEVEQGPPVTICRVSCARDDLGKLIGKHGRTASSMRTILLAACTRSGLRYRLDIVNDTKEEA